MPSRYSQYYSISKLRPTRKYKYKEYDYNSGCSVLSNQLLISLN
jgi:hypothetical protein